MPELMCVAAMSASATHYNSKEWGSVNVNRDPRSDRGEKQSPTVNPLPPI